MSERRARRARPFTAAELRYLADAHPLARLATVDAEGTPHVTPLGMYRVDDASGDIITSGRDLESTRKWRDVEQTGRAAIVIDDVLPPFRPRGVEVRGRAWVVRDGQPAIVIRPERILAWGLEDE